MGKILYKNESYFAELQYALSCLLSKANELVVMVCSCRVAEYLDVQEKRTDYNDDQRPVLMTKEVLAKFRTMEAKQQQQQQVPTQRRQVCA